MQSHSPGGRLGSLAVSNEQFPNLLGNEAELRETTDRMISTVVRLTASHGTRSHLIFYMTSTKPYAWNHTLAYCVIQC